MRTYVRARVSLCLTEYDAHQSWLLVGEPRQLTVELEDAEGFTAWAASMWPPPRYKVDPEPDALGPWRNPG